VSAAEIATTSDVKPTATVGVRTEPKLVDPIPSAPPKFDPQHMTPPPARAHVNSEPAVIAVTPLNPGTTTGARPVGALDPSCPDPFDPQHVTPPFVVITHVWELPPTTCVNPEVSAAGSPS